MDYSGEVASIQRQLAQCQDMVARRLVVLDTLGAGSGERILEAGCGAGLCLRELGVAVGTDGRVVGIDVSEDQVHAAAMLCHGLAHVEVGVGDVLAIPALDDDFDATVTIQVLEYVDDTAAAVAELARVTRSGGRFVNVATNWGALFWHGGRVDLTERVLAAWQRHAPHPNLPVPLPSWLHAHGFGAVHQRPVTIVNRHFQPNAWSYSAARLMAAFARTLAEIDDTDIEAWLASLDKADQSGDFFVSSVPVLTTATRLR